MKTKDIRDRIKAMGFEKGTVYTLEAMNEELLQTRRDIRELANYFDRMVDSMNGMMTVAQSMKDVLDARSQREDELGPNTHSLGNDTEN